MQVWRLAPRDLPAALVQTRRLTAARRRDPDVSFVKVCGTSSDRFTPRHATPTRWAAVTSWRRAHIDPDSHWWSRHAVEKATLRLRPLRTRGHWSGQSPFEPSTGDPDWSGPVVVLTRSTLRARKARAFYRAVPTVAAELRGAHGLRLSFGIGEAPVLWQGTVSLWESVDYLPAATHRGAHLAAIAATARIGWYAEELFARFALVSGSGSIDGTSVVP